MSVDTDETAPVRAGEEIDVEALANYLRGRIEGAEQGITIEQFPGGHSNLTYLVHTPVRDYVLRRPPFGPIPPKAHDMAREYAVLRAVHPVFPAAPRAYALCEDSAVIGCVFFLMERRHGIVIRDKEPPELRLLSDYRARVSASLVDCLADLHRVDIVRHGLAELGKPAGFMDRQVRGWAERWQRSRTEDVPAMDALVRWLHENRPESPPPTLVHNDFKLDNVMLDAHDPGRVAAVLDWEMATVGDPLADLGLLLCYWLQAAGLKGEPSLTRAPGWYTRDQIMERYQVSTGRDVTNIAYYEIFAIFKLAVVLQQIFFRFHTGQTSDERFRHFDARVRNLIDTATALV